MKITPEFEKTDCLRKELSKISYLGGNGDTVAQIISNRFIISDYSLWGVM